MTATNSTTPGRRRPRQASTAEAAVHRGAKLFLGLLGALAATVAGGCGAPPETQPAAAPSPSESAFSWFRSGPAPAGWKTLALPDGTAVLSIPPDAVAVDSDPGSVSATSTGPSGDLHVYLNSTPQQGEESLANWSAFRLDHLRDEHAASATLLSGRGEMFFRGGTGTCVADTYVTRIGAHEYREIACLVAGARGSSVVVVAAAASSWDHYSPVLEEAVDSYLVR